MTGLVTRQSKRSLQLPVGLSVLVHCVLFALLGQYGSYRFASPVRQMQAVMVDLTAAAAKPEPALLAMPPSTAVMSRKPPPAATREQRVAPPLTDIHSSEAGRLRQPDLHEPQPRTEQPTAAAETAASAGTAAGMAGESTVADTPMTHAAVLPPLKAAHHFMLKQWEKLDYRITMMGLPVGSAVLEADNEGKGVRIALSVKSAPLFSGIYPVDDLVETRHAGGNFIITKIRQQEGAFRSDRGFTIFLRDRRVFWMDLIQKRSVTETLPNGEVVDLLSGLYNLRTRPLQVGKNEMLHVYDSDRYVELPVVVLRREKLQLAGLSTLDTLVIKPLLTSEGIFKRTGDVTIWLTDDAHRVPVKVETQISLGKVTVELIAADTETAGPPRESVSANADIE